MYNNILLPIEERTATQTRIDTAVSITTQNDGRLHILHILDSKVETGSSKKYILDGFSHKGEQRIKDISESAEETLHITGSVVKGTLSKVVNDYQCNNNIDLTVVNGRYYDAIRGDKYKRNSGDIPHYLVVGQGEKIR